MPPATTGLNSEGGIDREELIKPYIKGLMDGIGVNGDGSNAVKLR